MLYTEGKVTKDQLRWWGEQDCVRLRILFQTSYTH